MTDTTGETLKRAVEEALADKDPEAAQGPAPVIPDRPPPPARPRADDIRIESELARKEAFADAHVLVSRAIVRCGRDPGNPMPSDSDAIQDIYAIMLKVQSVRGK